MYNNNRSNYDQNSNGRGFGNRGGYANSYTNRGRSSGGSSGYGASRGNFRRVSRSANKANEIVSAIMRSSQNNTQEVAENIEYIPKYSFADFPFIEKLKVNISKKGYMTPTPIQDQAIMPILDGRDVIGIASTGTGKTAAFLLPLIDKVARNKNEKVLIIAPTRELATQIYEEGRDFVQGLGMSAVLIIGGTSMGRQIQALNRGPEFVIGTPGRIKDLVDQGRLDLSRCTNVVLDEVDRMVDIGFIHAIKYLVAKLPKERQSLFFSATITGETRQILSAFVTDAVMVQIEKKDTTSLIKQEVIKITDRSKQIETLHELLNQKEFEKVIIFGRTKHGVQKLSDTLEARGFLAGAIHGNKRQSQRERVLADFRSSHIKILLATDVASRGIDIPNVTHVINYELPDTYDDYVHRIGRTGRANKTGVAITFVS